MHGDEDLPGVATGCRIRKSRRPSRTGNCQLATKVPVNGAHRCWRLEALPLMEGTRLCTGASGAGQSGGNLSRKNLPPPVPASQAKVKHSERTVQSGAVEIPQ
jgi:hypothetical protein